MLRTTPGDTYWVVEEGLGGRTTVFPDPVYGEYKSGRIYLPVCLESHSPIDLVVVLLGTSDIQDRFGLSAYDIALGAGILVDFILKSSFGPNGTAPKVLLICPPPVSSMSAVIARLAAGAPEKSRQLATYYEEIASQYRCEFMDAGQVIVSSEVDGIHFDASEHQKLGKAVAARVNEILADIPG